MNYQDKLTQDGRLCMLKELAVQVDGRLNEKTLMQVLETFGITRSRDWVRTQLRAMDELGVVHVIEAGTVMVASLTTLGRNHVERRAIVEGIARPSDED
ncbi:MAG: hypothetical protein P0Y59_02640 [Candidatus Sphingomonas phytovorans]|nr:hypothetical protein [Sphingomonas sp.]WEK00609.1 MAG: hypothetical protein P0Y59_02640 [Sphingomonas sp.]